MNPVTFSNKDEEQHLTKTTQDHSSLKVNPLSLLWLGLRCRYFFFFSILAVVVQFYPWFKFYFLLFLGMVMHDNDFETKENIS